MKAIFAAAAFAVSAAALTTAVSAPAREREAACPLSPLSARQVRIVDRAIEGIDALRRHVYITQATQALYLPDVVEWLDARRADERRCAAAEHASPTTTAGR
jgi:hypothetical protein